MAVDAEWRLLELVTAGSGAVEKSEVRDLVTAGTLDWGQVLDQAIRHRMLTMVAAVLIELRLMEQVPLRIGDHLRRELSSNRHRRDVWYSEADRVFTALGRAGVRAAARKGAAYEASIYSGDGRRWLGDIDVLARPDDGSKVEAVLESLGYEIGIYDPDKTEVTPFRREQLMKYRLNPDHLPTRSFVTRDPLAPVIEVDVAFSLTWHRTSYDVPVDDALATLRSQDVSWSSGSASLPVMEPEYQFLDTVLHLFREAWFDWWLTMEQDVDLMKFGDVLRLWRAQPSYLVDALEGLLVRYDLTKPVGWVLTHLDRTFDEQSVDQLGLTGQISEDFLSSAYANGGATRRWEGSMQDRLRVKARQGLFDSV